LGPDPLGRRFIGIEQSHYLDFVGDMLKTGENAPTR
jgi:hypothetical protein